MPSITKVEKALEAVNANPEAKELNLTFGDKKVTRGEYIGRAGKNDQASPYTLFLHFLNTCDKQRFS